MSKMPAYRLLKLKNIDIHFLVLISQLEREASNNPNKGTTGRREIGFAILETEKIDILLTNSGFIYHDDIASSQICICISLLIFSLHESTKQKLQRM